LTSTPKSTGRKGFKRANSTNEQIGNVDIENLNKKSELRSVEMTTVTTSTPSPKKKNRAKLRFNEKAARISTSISSTTPNLRTTLRRNIKMYCNKQPTHLMKITWINKHTNTR
jgi:hypothetical protein